MNASQKKVMQYLNEAHATELALVRVLQSQIAMAPRGSYRDGLERHLDETRDHAERVGAVCEELGQGGDVLTGAVGVVETVIGQALALGKTPFDLLRGSGGEEKMLKNAKDACATEAMEIATYTAIERLAASLGDEVTAGSRPRSAPTRRDARAPAARDPEAHRGRRRAPTSSGEPTYTYTKGAAERRMRRRETATSVKRTARQARKVPGVARAEGQVKGAVASESDLAIGRYDSLTADEIIGRLTGLSQIDLAKIDAYERKNQNRTTVLGRIDSLQGNEPWPGYDELTADEVRAVLADADDERIGEVRTYERGHKNRAGVLKAAEREAATA